MTKLGNIIIIISVITFAIKNGAADLNIFSMLNPVIMAQTFKQFPTGGVHAPTANPITKITPNSIGEIPMLTILGRKTGVKSKMAGLTSINVPDIKIIIANNKSMLVGFRLKVDIVFDIWSGILS